MTYQTVMPRELGEGWSDLIGGMTIALESDADSRPVTTLTGTVDQAALQGILRRLYTLGLL